MTCPKLKIPWPRWAIGDKPNPEQEHENYQALERWADGILKCIPAGATEVWAIASRPDCTKNMSTLAETGTWQIDFDDATYTWTTDGESITVPTEGIYVWAWEVNWTSSSSFDGTSRPAAGCKVGDWQWELSAINPNPAFAGVWNDDPIFYSGSGDFDQTATYYKSGLVGVATGGSKDVFVQSKPKSASWIGTPSGTIGWSEKFVIVRLTTSLADIPPCL